MELPYLEDIYDFGEEELNMWKERVGKALADYVQGTNDKWEWKAHRVQDLIQTELDERISINQISLFCFKELNSKLYKEVHSETQPLSDTQGSETAETASNLPSEPSVASSGSGWQPRPKMGKKEYQEYIRDKLRSTQVSSGVVIGGSSVPQSKTQPSRTKSSERSTKAEPSTHPKPSVEKPTSIVRKSQAKPQPKPADARSNIGKSLTAPPTKPKKAKEEAKSERSGVEKRGKEGKTETTAPAKPTKTSTEVVKKSTAEAVGGQKSQQSKGQKAIPRTTSTIPEPGKRQESTTEVASKPVSEVSKARVSLSEAHDSSDSKSTNSTHQVAETHTEATSVHRQGDVSEDHADRLPVLVDSKSDVSSEEIEEIHTDEERKNDTSHELQSESAISSSEKSSRKTSFELPTHTTAVPGNISATFVEQRLVAEDTPVERKLSDIEESHPKHTDPKHTDPKHTDPKHTDPKLTDPKHTEPKLTESESISSQSSLIALKLEDSSVLPSPPQPFQPSQSPKSFQPSLPSQPTGTSLSRSNSELLEEAKDSILSDGGDSGEEPDDAPEAVLTFSVGKSVVTTTSNLPPVTLKPKPLQKPLETILESREDTNRQAANTRHEQPKSEGNSSNPAQKPTTAESQSPGKLQTEAAMSKPASSETAKKPPRSSIPRPPKPAPKPKPRVATAPTGPIDDYSDIYHTIADLFNGGKQKEFDLLTAVRNCLSMFQDLEDQMSAPDFEFQRSFKFALAPLEMNPRDFLRNGGQFDMDATIKPPSDTEMYYRVVRAKQEVYDIVTRSFLKKPGWTELPHGMSLRCSWNVMWTWSKPRVDFGKLLVWQRVNHFPNSKQFSRKDNLKRNIERVAKQNAKCAQAWNIIPATFILPKEYISFCDEFAKGTQEDGNFWIMKPVGKSRGRGISLIKDITEVAYSEPMVIQKYLKHPLLLGGFKFDLRIYVLITGINPLEVFLYKEGFARMSTTQYTLNPDKLSNKFVHLTNSSIQKHNHNSQGDSLDHSFGGTKISLETLRQRLKFQGVEFEIIWQQIREIIVKSMLAVQYEMENTPSCFDLVGYDVLIDANLKAWLIEINSSPSLARDNVLDDLVKQTLIDDTLDLVSPLPFNRKKLIKILERRLSELQKGNVGSVTQLNADVSEVLGSNRPRRYGEMPEKLGNYERVAPSPLLDQYQKLMTAGKCSS